MESATRWRMRTWSKRSCFDALTIGLGIGAGIVYLYDNSQKVLAATLTVFGVGAVSIHWRRAARIAIRSNHAVVITGCDSGLGYSLAHHCRALNATVIAGVLQPEGLGARELLRNGVKVVPLDVTRAESVWEFGNKVRDIVRQENLVFRTLVNNAGVMTFGEFEWQTEEQTRRQVDVNLLGTMRVTKDLMPLMRSMGSRIIFVSSHCSFEPLPGVATYAATKAAISAWATALRVEVSKYGIDVVCFIPGSFTQESNILAKQSDHFEAMNSSMTEEAKNFYGDYLKRYEQYLAGMSREMLPRMLQQPNLYHQFDRALMDDCTRAVYKCEPWRYTFYHLLFWLSPTYIRDRLVERFMMMPRWKATDSLSTPDREVRVK
ncbi:retinol dehydrogenase 7 [Athalia rosae]|uniref:retinol dehydrogenase 7 n=1 Tax=Athalia rosae TaxID=37344 RepID=UPI0020341C4B|nr:retinol dehydrogenase 7 [Athalia rosae]XP_048507970.1 retinol dehydrogenase 7 [Athalia rosae]